MKPVKSFNEFRNELNEARQMNEGILDTIKGALKKIGQWFTGVGSKFLNAIVMQKDRKLKEGITVYPSKADMEALKAEGVAVSYPSEMNFVGQDPITGKHFKSVFDIYLEEDKFYESETPVDGEAVNEEDLNEAKVTMRSDTLQNIEDEEELKWKIRTLIEAGAEGEPVVIWGPPGIAKTAIVNAVAKEYSVRCLDYDLMTKAPEDFFLPSVEESTEGWYKKAKLNPEEYLPIYREEDGEKGDAMANGVDGKGGVLFFDEMARCNPRVQNVCLKILNERRIGPWMIGSKWVVVAACNRENDDPGTFNWTATLSNRVQMYNYVSRYQDWEKWAKTAKLKNGDPAVMPEILSFLNFYHEEYYYSFDPDKKEESWPSPRSWTKASKVLQQETATRERAGKKFSEAEMERTLAGIVGKDAASAYIGFVRLSQKMDPKTIALPYTDPAKAPKIKSLQVDERNALVAAILLHKKGATLSQKEMENFADWVIGLKDQVWAMKITTMFQDMHPYVKKDDFWIDTCIAKLLDSYPDLLKND
jgi:MoxR-like ATPase